MENVAVDYLTQLAKFMGSNLSWKPYVNDQTTTSTLLPFQYHNP